ncbi:protein of unknown function DUF1232 [Gloeothece citriformis PCC 7424]|uniref:DUF1232 domain-containing protein n=1 Tax=Gloeothece citriformis (strain PCC 7424) TaxID=65393 RepID=B7K7K7_GLOC7|nr:YkvA family protein [Gloeothece citriformis]ACK69775.1 protein of unknown function DUF1232 [Gloeothece citriformis PCC 7424]
MNHIVESFYSWYRSQIRNPKYRWLVLLGTVLYLVSPVDILPDFIPILGWIDDGVVLTLLMTEITRLITERRNGRNEIKNTETEPKDATVEVAATPE